MAKKVSVSRTEVLRGALHASRKAKTCRELMEHAGLEKDDFKFAASILVGMVNRGEVAMAGTQQCSISGRVSQAYLRVKEEDRPAKEPKEAVDAEVAAAPKETKIAKEPKVAKATKEPKPAKEPKAKKAAKIPKSVGSGEQADSAAGSEGDEKIKVELASDKVVKFHQRQNDEGIWELVMQVVSPKFEKAKVVETSPSPYDLRAKVAASPAFVEFC